MPRRPRRPNRRVRTPNVTEPHAERFRSIMVSSRCKRISGSSSNAILCRRGLSIHYVHNGMALPQSAPNSPWNRVTDFACSWPGESWAKRLGKTSGVISGGALPAPSALHSPFSKLMGGDWKRDRRLGLEMERNGPRGKKNVCCRFRRG